MSLRFYLADRAGELTQGPDVYDGANTAILVDETIVSGSDGDTFTYGGFTPQEAGEYRVRISISDASTAGTYSVFIVQDGVTLYTAANNPQTFDVRVKLQAGIAASIESTWAIDTPGRIAYQLSFAEANFTEAQVTPPEGWDELETTFKRDPEFGGAFFEFSEVELPLTFHNLDVTGYGVGGYGIIVEAYETLEDLADMDMVLRVETRAGIQEVYRGKMDFGSIEVNKTLANVGIGVRQIGVLQAISSRIDTPVNLFNATTISGNPIDAYAKCPYEVTMHSQLVRKQSLMQAEVGQIIDARSEPFVRARSIAFGPVIRNEIQSVFSVLDVSSDGVILPVFTNNGNEAVTILIEIKCTPVLYYTFGAGAYNVDFETSGGVANQLLAKKATGPITDFVGSTVLDSRSSPPADLSGSGPATVSRQIAVYEPAPYTDTLQPGESLYMAFNQAVTVTADNPVISRQVQFNDAFFSIIQDSVAAESLARLVPIHEALGRAIDKISEGAISSGEVLFRSELYGRESAQPFAPGGYSSDGVGAFRVLGNGYSIRGYPDSAFNVELSDILDTIRAIDTAGIGIVIDQATGKQVIRVEKRAFFFQNGLPEITFKALGEIRERMLEDEVYVTIESGFEEYKSETEFGNQFEPNGSAVFDTGSKVGDSALDIVCPAIGAGVLIELVRRDQYLEAATKDNKYDEDIFIVCVKRTEGTIHETETDDFIVSSDGIFSPETTYNLDIVPARNLARWLPILNRTLRPVQVLPNAVYQLLWDIGYQAYPPVTADAASAVLPASLIDDDDKRYRVRQIEFEAALGFAQFQDFFANPYATYAVEAPEGTIRFFVDELAYKFSSRTARIVGRISVNQT